MKVGLLFVLSALPIVLSLPALASETVSSTATTTTTTSTVTTSTTTPQEETPVIPVAGGSCITSHYGQRRLPRRGWHFHTGVDFRARPGTELIAMDEGTVVDFGRYRACGLFVEIQLKDGNYAHYCHLSKFKKFVKGEKVAKGQVLGLSGTTGSAKHQPHLHLVIKPTPGFAPGNTMEPLKYFPTAETCEGKS